MEETIISVSRGPFFAPQDTLRIQETGELVRVTSISTTTITWKRVRWWRYMAWRIVRRAQRIWWRIHPPPRCEICDAESWFDDD